MGSLKTGATGGCKHRKKGAVGTGRRRKSERRVRERSKKEAEAQLAFLKRAQQERLAKEERIKQEAKASKKKKKTEKQACDDSDDGDEHFDDDDASLKKKNKKRPEAAATSSKSTGFERTYKPERPSALHFERCFWRGTVPPAGDEPTEELKQARRELGIKVRGAAVPSPIHSIADEALPPSFRQLFSGKKSGGLSIEKPTPIQSQVWPAALCGLDVIGIAPTGSGKTLAYLAPAVPHILGQKEPTVRKGKGQGVKCLVLVPTRELAKQVCDVCSCGAQGGWLRRLFDLRAGALYGGQGKETQLDGMVTMGPPHILAATPGRLLDLLGLDVFSLEPATFLVLDEADRMLALGFEPQLSALMKGIRPNRQVLLFSATFPGKLRESAEQWMAKERVLIRVGGMELDAEQETAGMAEKQANAGKSAPDVKISEHSGVSTLTVSPTVHQTVRICTPLQKSKLLVRFLQKIRAEEKAAGVRGRAAVLVFSSQIALLRAVAKLVEKSGERCAPLHSGIPQGKREQALEDLKRGQIDTLVATDVASRGIHVSRLRYVINYDFPQSLEQYCHRIGRVGRQGVEGWAYSFFTPEDKQLAAGLMALMSRCKQPVSTRLRALAEGREVGDQEGAEASDREELGPTATSTSAAVPVPVQAGAIVRLQGLTSAPELNGVRGCVCREIPEVGRWEVVLAGKSGEVKRVKPENLVVDRARPASAKLRTGAKVSLTGLNAAPQLNGRSAYVRRKVVKTGRWEVVLEGTDDVKAVRDDNLEVLTSAGPDDASLSNDEQEPEFGAAGTSQTDSTKTHSQPTCENIDQGDDHACESGDEIEEAHDATNEEASVDEDGTEDEEEEEEEQGEDEADLARNKKRKRGGQKPKWQRQQEEQKKQSKQAAGTLQQKKKRKRHRDPKKKRRQHQRAAAAVSS